MVIRRQKSQESTSKLKAGSDSPSLEYEGIFFTVTGWRGRELEYVSYGSKGRCTENAAKFETLVTRISALR